VIGMGMGNYGFFYRFPWVNEKVCLWAVQTIIGKFDE
jgi:hypothetical protein